MKIRLSWICLAIGLAAGIFAASPVSAMKAEFTGDVSYNGSKLVSDFTSDDIARAMYAMQPGDSTAIVVTAKNTVDKPTDWYFSNQVIRTLEDSRKASGGAYTYKLSYKGSGTENILYDSTVVGGDSTAGGVGMHQVDGALKDYFYLDRLSRGDSGVVTLVVGLDGETQGNAYQSTLAQIRMSFGVEEVPEDEDDNGGDLDNVQKGKEGKKGGHKTVTSPKTGDTSRLLSYSMMALAAGVLMMLLVVFQLITGKKEKEDGCYEDA